MPPLVFLALRQQPDWPWLELLLVLPSVKLKHVVARYPLEQLIAWAPLLVTAVASAVAEPALLASSPPPL